MRKTEKPPFRIAAWDMSAENLQEEEDEKLGRETEIVLASEWISAFRIDWTLLGVIGPAVTTTGLAGTLAFAARSVDDRDDQGVQDKFNSDGCEDDNDGQVQRRNPVLQNQIQQGGQTCHRS